jgi:hypothetical protein
MDLGLAFGRDVRLDHHAEDRRRREYNRAAILERSLLHCEAPPRATDHMEAPPGGVAEL